MDNEEIENDIRGLLANREALQNQIKNINAILIYLANKQKELMKEEMEKRIKEQKKRKDETLQKENRLG